jgi:uncharacterized GH25 family protein
VCSSDLQLKKGIGLTGRVLSPAGAPVEGATVTANIRESFSPLGAATSDSNGRFELFLPKEGAEVILKARQDKLQLQGEIEWEVKAGVEAEIRLEKYGKASVRGKVLDKQGKPLRNAEIKLDIINLKTGMGTSRTTARTDRNGNYRVDGIIIGSQSSLLVEMDGFAPTVIKMPPLISDIVEAEDTVMLRAERWIEGTVRDVDGMAISGARVIVNGSSSGFKQAKSDDNGRYRLDGLVPEVEPNVDIDHKEYGWFMFDTIPTNERRDFILPRGKNTFSGKVVDESGAPVERALVSIVPQRHPSGRLYASMQADSKGNFLFEHVIDDTVSVEISRDRNQYPMHIPGFRLSGKDTTFVLKKNASAPERMGTGPEEMHPVATGKPFDAAGAAAPVALTDADRKALEEGTGRAGYILMDLRRKYEKSGSDVLKPVIPTLLTGAQKYLHQKEYLGEEGETLAHYIFLLSRTGDPRTRPFFLELMVNDGVGGSLVTEGLLALGKSVLPAIEDSLSSPRAISRAQTASYLGSMVKMDSAGKFFTPKDKKRIFGRLSALLADNDEKVRKGAARGLGAMENRLPLKESFEILGNEPVEIHPGVTIMPFDKWQITDKEKNGGPAFVDIPNQFDNRPQFKCLSFYLPSDARTRIELSNLETKVASTLMDEPLQKGIYQLHISGALYPLENGKYTVRLIVDRKLVGTKEFAINTQVQLDNPDKKNPGMTIEPVVKESLLRMIPDEEKNGGPAFVKEDFPNPFSNMELFFFHLPAAARTRIDLCDEGGTAFSTLIDEHAQRGVYQLKIIRVAIPLFNGKYTVRLFVNDKPAGTREFTVGK